MELFCALGSDVGGLTVLSYLGGHADSQVFLAEAQGGDLFAIKALRPSAFSTDAIKAYRREVSLRITPRVRSCQVGSENGVVYAAAPFIAGESLGQLLARYPRVHSELAREIIGQAAESVAEIHAHGLVHGALKPGNLLLSAHGGRLSVFVLDLGSRHLQSFGGEEATVQLTGSALEYNSPEQAQGHTPTSRSDVFTLGILLYEMLAGSVPFPGGVGYSTRGAQALGKINPDADAEIAALADRILAARGGGESPSISDIAGLRRHRSSAAVSLDEEEATIAFPTIPAASRSSTSASHGSLEEKTVGLPAYESGAFPERIVEDSGTRAIEPIGSMSGFWSKAEDKPKPRPKPTTTVDPPRPPPPPQEAVGAWTSEKKLLVANAAVAFFIIVSIIVLALTG